MLDYVRVINFCIIIIIIIIILILILHICCCAWPLAKLPSSAQLLAYFRVLFSQFVRCLLLMKLILYECASVRRCIWRQGTVQQLLDKKDDMKSQDEVCTTLGKLERHFQPRLWRLHAVVRDVGGLTSHQCLLCSQSPNHHWTHCIEYCHDNAFRAILV